MKMRVWNLLFAGLFLILILPFVFASEHISTDQEKVDEAYQCLNDKVVGNCDSLSLGEKTFSLLAINKCNSELISDSEIIGSEERCWPSGNCNVKETAQAVIALDNSGSNTDDAKDWLLNQKAIPGDIEWFLQIDALNASTCSLKYSSASYSVDILEDKKLTNNAGSCLTRAQGDYWFRISPSCFSEEFEISCDESFLTNLLFKKTSSSTIHVLDETSSASSGGSTFENVESSCLGTGNCNYEGTLWGAMALDSLGEGVSDLLPYLITGVDENPRLIPETFLYFLTGNEDYRSQVLLGQKSSKWWSESGDKYYDTALALFPFKNEDPVEKKNSKDWLLTTQDGEGCWQGNIRNTAFILASLWPEDFSSSGGGGGSGLDCESAGNYCMSGASCQGSLLNEYSCPGLFRCCSTQNVLETCSERGGDICSSGESCRGNTIVTEDSSRCCVGGFCESVSSGGDLTACELEGGACRFTCESNEEEVSSLSCAGSGGICCVFDSSEGKTSNTLWIWVLLILILLVIFGIVFRDKLRTFWFRLKSKFGKGRPSGPSTGPRSLGRHGLPSPRHRPLARVSERKILSNSPKPKTKRVPSRPSRSQKELDDVLKKLKDMSR